MLEDLVLPDLNPFGVPEERFGIKSLTQRWMLLPKESEGVLEACDSGFVAGVCLSLAFGGAVTDVTLSPGMLSI